MHECMSVTKILAQIVSNQLAKAISWKDTEGKNLGSSEARFIML